MKSLIYMSVAMSCILNLAGEPVHSQTRRRSNSRTLVTCEYKTIGVPGDNSENQKLSRSYDLRRLAASMKSNRAYEVSEHYNGEGIIISRTFNGVKYNILFEKREGVSQFNLNTYNFKGYPNGTAAWGRNAARRATLLEGQFIG